MKIKQMMIIIIHLAIMIIIMMMKKLLIKNQKLYHMSKEKQNILILQKYTNLTLMHLMQNFLKYIQK